MFMLKNLCRGAWVMVGGVLLMAAPLSAAELSVRVYDHQDRVRMVLEPDQGTMPSPIIKVIDDQTIEIGLASPLTMKPVNLSPQHPEIVDVRVVSNPGDALRFWVVTKGKLYQRYLSVGNRLFIEFKQSASARATPDAAPSTPKTSETKAVLDPIPQPTTQPALQSTPPLAATPQIPKTLTLDPANPPVVTLSSVEKFGIAAFVVGQRLWVVVDEPDFVGVPKFSGQGGNRLGPMDRQVTKDATVFTGARPAAPRTARAAGGD